MVQDNKDKFNSFSLHLILLQSVQDNQQGIKMPNKNIAVINDNKI